MQDETAITGGIDEPSLETTSRQGKPRLSGRMFRLLVRGDEAGRYGGDPMRIAAAIIAEAARVGMDVGQLIHLMMRDEYAGGEWVRGLSASHRHRTVERLYATSFNNYTQPFENAVDARLYVNECMGCVRAAAMPYRRESARRVLAAHLQVAMDAGCTRYSASIRRLAILAGVGVETARGATAWAIEQGMIHRERQCRGAQAATYRISRNFVSKVESIVPTVKGGCIGTTSNTRADVNHVVFSYGTGMSWPVWCALSADEGMSDKCIAEAAGRARRTVRRCLRRFEKYGVAAQLDDGTWVSTATVEDLDRVAEHLGVNEVIATREKRIRAEQQQMREWMSRILCSGSSSSTSSDGGRAS